jgi:hypothetical protein
MAIVPQRGIASVRPIKTPPAAVGVRAASPRQVQVQECSSAGAKSPSPSAREGARNAARSIKPTAISQRRHLGICRGGKEISASDCNLQRTEAERPFETSLSSLPTSLSGGRMELSLRRRRGRRPGHKVLLTPGGVAHQAPAGRDELARTLRVVLSGAPFGTSGGCKIIFIFQELTDRKNFWHSSLDSAKTLTKSVLAMGD